MDRRRFLASAGLLLSAPALTLASPIVEKQAEPGVMPYLTLGPFAEDAQKVYFFFQYSCPFCYDHWRAIHGWGRTLPKSIRFVPMPVLSDTTSLSAAAAYYSVKSQEPAKLDKFHELAYQRSKAAFVTPDTYIQILRELGVSNNINRQAIKNQLERIVTLMARYRTAATPHFGVCGNFATNANFTNGDYRMLGQLLNALVSQHLGGAA